jgi:hypothetical protein
MKKAPVHNLGWGKSKANEKSGLVKYSWTTYGSSFSRLGPKGDPSLLDRMSKKIYNDVPILLELAKDMMALNFNYSFNWSKGIFSLSRTCSLVFFNTSC